jgi:hypothetical protein
MTARGNAQVDPAPPALAAKTYSNLGTHTRGNAQRDPSPPQFTAGPTFLWAPGSGSGPPVIVYVNWIPHTGVTGQPP